MLLRCLAACLCLLAAPVLAEPRLTPLASMEDGRAYAGIGRIDLAGRGFCTGTLISDRLVLTAAHCLFDRRTGTRMAASELTFLPGFRQGRAATERRVRRAVAHPDFVWEDADRINRIAADLALLELAQPVRAMGIPPLPVATRAEGLGTVSLVSYAHDRAELPSLEPTCAVLAEAGRAQVLDCDVDFGASGAPVLARGQSGPVIIGVVTAKSRWQGREVGMAARLDTEIAALEAALAAEATAAPRVMQGGGGARFLRP